MKLLIKDIQTLVQVETSETHRQQARGTEMAQLPTIDNAYLLIEDDKIADYGPTSEAPAFADKIISAEGRLVFPCWCDPHTHLVFAGSREGEFVDRIRGLSYEEIARRGGGILNSARLLNDTPEEVLLAQSYERLNEIKAFGTGAVEIKSGYGLTVEGELKMLRVIRQLKRMSPVTIRATFLGAHALPQAYKANRQGYIELIIKEMLPQIASEKLADYIDVFCDRGFFTAEETDQLLQAGADHGLKPKIHANELDFTGGIQVGVKNGAVSVDHLECTGEEEIEALRGSGTMPTVLPSTAFFLGMNYPPARNMIDAGLPVALATDYNPGSAPSGKMAFVCALACIKMGLVPEEAIQAATLNAAYAMELQAHLGSIGRGKHANIFITKPMPSYAFLPYAFGSDLVESVILNGQLQ